MIDVIISYKREEREFAREIAKTITRQGFSVWWDVDLLPGDKFSEEIEAVINQAKSTIVIWSEVSAKSNFVIGEASLALGLSKLIPVRIDDVEVPLEFRNQHILDLRNWVETLNPTDLEPIIGAIAKTSSGSRVPLSEPSQVQSELARPEDELNFWKSVTDREPQSVKEYEAYIQIYGSDGTFAQLARIRIEALISDAPKPVKRRTNLISTATCHNSRRSCDRYT